MGAEEAPYVSKLARTEPEYLFGGLSVKGKPRYLGIGEQSEDGNSVQYVVVSWPEIQELRERFGLPKKDLHVTLGYTQKDIHGVPKDESTLIEEFDTQSE